MGFMTEEPFLGALMLEEQRAAMKSIRTSKRANDTISHVRANSRVLFFDALYRLAPEVGKELLESDAIEFFHALESCSVPEGDLTSAEIDAVMDGPLTRFNGICDGISAWQHRYNLTDEWILEVVSNTIEAALANGRTNIPLVWTVKDSLASPLEGKRTDGGRIEPTANNPSGMVLYHSYLNVDIPVTLDDMKLPNCVGIEPNGYETDIEDDGYFGDFNPRSETIDEAVKRLTPALQKRLRYTLNEIVKFDEQLPGACKPVTFRKATAFEWLVRYQVLGEKRADIAKADGVDRTHVTREISKAARLIGLTLREVRGGRPPKNRPHIIKTRALARSDS